MKEEPDNKCKKVGFIHAWEDITSNIIYASYPPNYPPKQEVCMNCGLKRTYRTSVERWFEYELTSPDPVV